MSFEHYNVEVRDRVKCISGVEGRHFFIFFLKTEIGLRPLSEIILSHYGVGG